MTWFVSARKYKQLETAYELAKKLADERQARIYLLEEKVSWQERVIAAMPTTGSFEMNRADVAVIAGRSGWRTRAQVASEQTVPQPKDSIQALEQRVAKEGGKTDAV